MAQRPSPRDHDADANPVLSRKRPRLGDESKSPVHIEIFAPEEVGTSFVDAIKIEDDNMPPLYSDDFAIDLNLSAHPFDQIRFFRQECLSDRYVYPFHVLQVSLWLERHLNRTADLDAAIVLQGYLQDDLFFGVLGQACWGLLQRRDEAFDENMPSSHQSFKDVLLRFFEQLQVLGTRFIQLLPRITTDNFTRRDSAQVKSGAHHIPALYYLHVLRALLVVPVQTPLLSYVQSSFGVDVKKLIRHGQMQFVEEEGTTRSLVTILGNLARNAREVHEAWNFMDSTLLLIRALVVRSGSGGNELAVMVGIINSLLLPPILEKHPRVLPEEFHAHVVDVAATALRAHAMCLDIPSVYRLYDSLVKGENDALLEVSQDERPSFEALWATCQGDKEMLANHVATAWALQVEKSFLFSDIIDVRTCGITLLTNRLNGCFHDFVALKGADHPLVQYTSRFLRVNELIKYIFSADSHASLGGHSAQIVSFLVWAKSYSEQETDILWEACTNSAEVEFSKASCAVLRQVCINLERDQLLYVIRQYAKTSVSRMGPDIIDLLKAIYIGIETKTPVNASQESRLASAFASLEMLRHLAPDTFRPSTNTLRTLAITELSRYVGYNADDRLKIYETCIADLSGRTKHATTSADVLRLFLSNNTTSAEVEKLLDVLPLNRVVDELCAFVQQVENSDRANIHSALLIRLDLILLLMYLTPNSHERTVEDLLFTFLFGDLSLDIYAREEAWKRLTSSTGALCSAQVLLDRYLVEFVPMLNADLATPHLIEIFRKPLEGRITADALEDTPKILTHPLWMALVRFALDSDKPEVNHAANVTLQHLLFQYPQSLSSKEAIVHSQTLFGRDLVDKLCEENANEDCPRDESKDSWSVRAVNLLSTLLHVSRATRDHFLQPAETDILSIGELDSADTLHFRIQLCSSERQARFIEIKTHSLVTVTQLAGAVKSYTGVAEHRMIVAGKEIDLKTNAQSTLTSVGIQNLGVVMISPRYTFNCELGAVLKPSGPVEQTITEQYDRLERLVDGPRGRSVARVALDFLRVLKPSKAARERVMSVQTSLNQLFDNDLPYRTCHSLHILDCQLRDFAVLGAIDEGFILRTVHRLMTFIMEPSADLEILVPIFRGMKTFLCGKPLILHRVVPSSGEIVQKLMYIEYATSETSVDVFENPAEFVERIMTLLSMSSKLLSKRPQDPAPGDLIRILYSTLLEAFRKDPTLWDYFMKNGNTLMVHSQLLLLDDFELTAQLSKVMDDFCKESSSTRHVSKFYWSVIEETLPKAMTTTASPTAFFNIALSLLRLRHIHEADLRGFTESTISYVWSYSHNESPRLPVPDATMMGLLRLLHSALLILRSFKKPLNLQRLPCDIFKRLLFPYRNDALTGDSTYRPLICRESRKLAFEIVKMTCETIDSYCELTAAALEAMSVLFGNDAQIFPGTEDWLRAASKCSGLTNLGMTCYMNSLLQQLFANLQFRKFLLHIPVVHKDEQAVLIHVQHLFANMQDSSKPCTDTVALAKALGVHIESQEDVHGFFATFFSMLEDNMPDDDTKRKLSEFFTGKFITQIKGSCGHVSTQTEPFIDVSITVKNKASLQESLNEFVQGEPMKGANRYRCLTCSSEGGEGCLVNAMKRTCLDEVPDNLTFCLKRFTFEAMMGHEGKANDRFEFPAEIDMAVYQRSHLEQTDSPVVPDMFELVGVIVHQGSLEFGHYWSYIRMGGSMDPSKWFLVEDRTVKPILGGVQEVQRECFGGTVYPNGNERPESAYVLLYQRTSRFHERHQVISRTPGDERLSPLLPPHVETPAELDRTISVANDRQYRIAHLFDFDYASFVTWLMESPFLHRNPTIEAPQDQHEQQQSAVILHTATMNDLAKTAAHYLLGVVVCDFKGDERFTLLSPSLTKAMDASLILTKLFLNHLTADHPAFHRIWRTESRTTRLLISNSILSWINNLKSRDAISGRTGAQQVIAAHSSLLDVQMDCLYPHWAEYCGFISLLAMTGPFETALAHKSGYIEWAVDIMTFDWQPNELRSRRRLLAKAIANNALDMKILFDLLCGLLNHHVDMSDTAVNDPGTSPEFNDGRVKLHVKYWNLFLCEMPARLSMYMALLIVACQHCSFPLKWKESSSGKFFARLVADRPNIEAFRHLEASLLVRLDEETEALEHLLQIVLNVCLVRDDHDMAAIMKGVAKTALSWENVEAEIIEFWSNTMKLAPAATLEATPIWALEYLSRMKKGTVRQRTVLFLCENLFDPPPLDGHECDTLRIQLTRVLVGKLIPYLTHAYRQEVPRKRCEEMMRTLEHAAVYLETLHEEVKKVKAKGNDQSKKHLLPHALYVEYEESRSTLMDIERLLADLFDWVTEPVSDISPGPRTISKCSADASVISGDGPGLDGEELEEGSFISDDSVDQSLDHTDCA